MIRVLIAVLVSLIYATVRYNVFKGVPWSEWPIYITNKALALASLIMITWMLACRLTGRKLNDDVRNWTAACMGVHILLSLALLSPEYYADFYKGPKLTAVAGFSLLLGGIAARWPLMRLRRSESHAHHGMQLGFVGVLAGTHAGLFGFSGWLSPQTWPGYMLPITLISFALGLSALILGAAGYFRRGSKHMRS